MAYYPLGDGGQEESTGYLYLEFRKSGTEEYRTVGVGMQAQQGKGIDRREARLRALTQDSEDARTEMRRSMRELNDQIAGMHHPPNASVVTILHYHRNGTQRLLEDTGL